MSKYDLAHLIKQWELEKLTAEQMIGQLLLHVRSLDERVCRLERPTDTPTKLVQSAMKFVGEEEIGLS